MEKDLTFRDQLVDHLKESKATDILIAKIHTVQEAIVRDLINDTAKHDHIALGLEELLTATTKINQHLEGGGTEGIIKKVAKHERYFNNQAGAYRLLVLVSLIMTIAIGYTRLL